MEEANNELLKKYNQCLFIFKKQEQYQEEMHERPVIRETDDQTNQKRKEDKELTTLSHLYM